MQQARPEDVAGHGGEIVPAHTGRGPSSDDAPGTGSGDEGRANPRIRQSFEDADVREPANRTPTQSQTDATGVDIMQPTHLTQVYGTEARIRHFAHLAHELEHVERGPAGTGRSRFTRAVDRVILWVRNHFAPVHWAGAASVAFLLYLYVRLVGATARLTTSGTISWSTPPAPGILAIWHGNAPSLLCAIAIQRPRVPLAIMITTEPRGDCLAILCRLLGVRVTRGSGVQHGWEALSELAAEIERGACAILTPDGGGRSHVAKAGAVLLAAAIQAPLVAAGAYCRPAFTERRKWDSARNPLPFGHVAIVLSEPLVVQEIGEAASLDAPLSWLQQQLDCMEAEARQTVLR